MERVAFGGGPLRSEVGASLVSQGVRLTILYGMTETGCMTKFFSETYQPNNWEYFEFSPHITANLIPHEEDQFELTILPSENHCCATNVDDGERPSQVFHTNDLLSKHPSLPMYRIIGRLDDQIMLSNSEKTNPAPLEEILCSHEAIEGAVMFGRGKPQNGVILEPSAGFEIDIDDPKAIERYLDIIWPAVQEVNRFAPTHSRLTRSLILIIDPRVSPLPRTSKGAVSRAKTIKTYEGQIDNIYQKAEHGLESSNDKIISDLYDTNGEVSQRKIVMAIKSMAEELFDHELDEIEDLFKQGCDSLRSASIRSKILAILKSKSIGHAPQVPSNIVYQEPSILKLAIWLQSRLAGLEGDDPAMKSNQDKLTLEKMNEMVRKYTPRSLKTFLITGTTGFLGSYVLADILQNRDVDRVFALNRINSGGSMFERHSNSFQGKGLDCSILLDDRLTFLEADNLHDLTEAQLAELSISVTHILHLSYPVEFNFRLESFEAAIRFTAELTQLFQNSFRPARAKPTFVFASSVATLANYSGAPDQWVDEAEVGFESSIGSGYGESKRVCEKVIEESAKSYGYRSIVIRIGQLCGSRSSGAWNHREWFPLLAQSGVRLGCLPTGKDDVAWIPIDEAAMVFNDLAFHDPLDVKNDICYRHLVNPNPISWHRIISRFQQLLRKHPENGSVGKSDIRLVSYSEWFQKLSEIAQDQKFNVEEIGAAKLIDHFRHQLTQRHGGLHQIKPKGYEAMGVKRLETKLSEGESVHLKNCRSLSVEDVDMWFNYWIKVGLFKNSL